MSYAQVLQDRAGFLAREEARAQAAEALGRELRAVLDANAWARPGFAVQAADLLRRAGIVLEVPGLLNGWRLAYVSGPGAGTMRLEAALEEAATHFGLRAPATIRSNAQETLRMAEREVGIRPDYVPDSHKLQTAPVPVVATLPTTGSSVSTAVTVPVPVAVTAPPLTVQAPGLPVNSSAALLNATILGPGMVMSSSLPGPSILPGSVPAGAVALTGGGPVPAPGAAATGGAMPSGSGGWLDGEAVAGVANKWWVVLGVGAALALWMGSRD